MAEEQRVRGACPMDCPDTCSWIVTIKDGRAVKLEGDRAHPLTRGALCNFRPISPASLPVIRQNVIRFQNASPVSHVTWLDSVA